MGATASVSARKKGKGSASSTLVGGTLDITVNKRRRRRYFGIGSVPMGVVGVFVMASTTWAV